MKRTKNEYGGYLPLELAKRKEYFSYENNQMKRFNCAKAAIAYALEHMDVDVIYMPHYMCPNVCKEVENHGIDVKYYHLDNQLLPVNVQDEKNACIYVTDYFGVMDEKITSYVKSMADAKVIMDNCHSFFHEPVMSENVYNVYSCKKFFGVPDGAYLIAKQLEDDFEEEVTYSSENAMYLLQSLERGTNYCYTEKKKADAWLADKYGNISVLGRKMLESLDYTAIRDRRHANFNLYQEAFADINLIACEKESVPYIYPLNVGKDIKQQLVANKIYVPTLWGQTLDSKFEGTLEYHLSKNTIFLPLDQRYDDDDIGYIIDIVKGVLNNE